MKPQTLYFLEWFAKKILRDLDISYTRFFLRNVITGVYRNKFAAPEFIYGSGEELFMTDPNDANNMAIALIDVLEAYHVKTEVFENPFLDKQSTELIIFKQLPEHDYKDFLGIVVYHHNEPSIQKANGQIKKITSDLVIENSLRFKASVWSGEPAYRDNQQSQKLTRVFQWSALLCVLLLLSFTLHNGLQVHWIKWFPELILLMAGMFISYSILVLEQRISSGPKWLEQICGAGHKKNNCRKVLFSKASRFLGIVHMSDMGSVYFVSMFSFVILSLLTNTYIEHLPALLWLAVIPLPYSFYSFYYQIFILNEICALCMLTMLIFWIQFVTLFIVIPSQNLFELRIEPFVYFAGLILVISVVYFLALHYKNSVVKIKKLETENSLYKKDLLFFDNRSVAPSKFNAEEIPGILKIGEQSAQIKLTAILSLACLPCAAKLFEILKLADWFHYQIAVSIMIIPDEKSSGLSKHILQASIVNGHDPAIRLLQDWYTILQEETDKGILTTENIRKKWMAKFSTIEFPEKTEELYAAQCSWAKTTHIPFTPFLLYNDHVLPSVYYDFSLLSKIITAKLEKDEII
jgi:uncharacterized membrane protein